MMSYTAILGFTDLGCGHAIQHTHNTFLQHFIELAHIKKCNTVGNTFVLEQFGIFPLTIFACVTFYEPLHFIDPEMETFIQRRFISAMVF
jgi:hypothetical protein